MKMKKICLLAVILPAAVSMTACSGGSAKPATVSPRTVKIVVAAAPGGNTSVYPGIVREARSVSVGFKTAGQISRINVKEGDYVREGELLASLDDSDYKLGVEAVQAQYDQVAAEVARVRELYRKNSVSANDYEKAESGLKQLGVQLQVNRNKVAYTKLCSPLSGYVRAVNFSKSEMVDAGTPVFTIMDVSRLEINVDIPAAEYRNRDSFSSLTAKSPSGETLPVKVVGIVPKADGNQLYRMVLAFGPGIDLEKTSFLPGTNVSVLIGRPDGTSAVNGDACPESGNRALLPITSILYDGKQAYVWEVGADTVLVRTNVEIEVSDNAALVLAEGIEPGTEVVSAGAASLKEGEKVRILAKPSETNVGGLL